MKNEPGMSYHTRSKGAIKDYRILSKGFRNQTTHQTVMDYNTANMFKFMALKSIVTIKTSPPQLPLENMSKSTPYFKNW